MSSVVQLRICDVDREMLAKEHLGQRVVTFKDVDDLHQRPDGTASRNFREHRDKFIDGTDFFLVKPGDVRDDEIRRSEINNSGTYLLTESGYLMLVKSFTDDLAWQVQRQLVNVYFRAKSMFRIPKSLPEALRMAAELAEQIERQAPLVAFAETAAKSKSSVLIRELAKICCKGGIQTGERRLYQKLREWGMIISGKTEPYQEYVDRGYFEVSEGTHETNKGVSLHTVTRVLPKGQQYIMHRLREEANGQAQPKSLAK